MGSGRGPVLRDAALSERPEEGQKAVGGAPATLVCQYLCHCELQDDEIYGLSPEHQESVDKRSSSRDQWPVIFSPRSPGRPCCLRAAYSLFPLAGWPPIRKVFGYSPSPQILNEPKSLYQGPSGASGSDSRHSLSW